MATKTSASKSRVNSRVTDRNSPKAATPPGKPLRPHASSFKLSLPSDIIQGSKTGDSLKVSTVKTGTKPVKKTTMKTAPLTSPKAATEKEKVSYDKDATVKFDAMLDGDMTDLPPLPKSMVRLFLSSTFSDMREERNLLARIVYPELRKFCASQDLDFQVVDMRWGVMEESQNDHSVEKLCLLEVENCQKASRGPNFVVISGDRYGFRPIPTEIKVKEFETLRQEAIAQKLESRELLDEWYKLDSNSIPPEYVLQPIRSKFTFFGDHAPGCDEPREKDTAEWWKTFHSLQKILRVCADSAFKAGNLSEMRRHEYFLSVTECEIQKGILEASDVEKHTLVYHRAFRHLAGAALNEDKASRHIDVIEHAPGMTEIDKESHQLRSQLVEKKIPDKLKKSSIKHFTVDWQPGGIDPTTHQGHKAYLKEFCSRFVTDCVALIKQAKQSQIKMSNYYSDYDETVHHLRFCLKKCESFCGQKQVLMAAKQYILDESGRKPFVIYADSGAGKTSIMAMIMKCIPEWLTNKDHVKLIRFLGTTPNSINIFDVLDSVCGQLADATDFIIPPINYRNMKNLVDYLPRFFRDISGRLGKDHVVVVLLDSIDQLSSADKAFNMEWLPTLLPANFKLILSTLPQEHNILANLRKVLPDDSCYMEVPLLPLDTGKEILKIYLESKHRCLAESQTNFLLSVFKRAPSPLFLKLLLDQAKTWHSYTRMHEILLPSNVKEAINSLFGKLEAKFGTQLVSSALGYLTVGKNGLSEIEIEDVLSCDDLVLDEVYRFHDPPVSNVVRIPPVLWARIHYDIKEYLVERISHGKNTLNWYHRQFMETARARYTGEGKDGYLHKNLADIYLAENGIQRTIKLSQRKNLVVTDADRQVTPQPFTSQNKRKLACLPYHIINGGAAVSSDLAKAEVFCNCRFISTSINAFSLRHVINILTQYTEATGDSEVAILRNFLSVIKWDIRSAVRLAVSLLAFIQTDQTQIHLRKMLKDAEDFLMAQTTPLLIPVFAGLAARQDTSSALNSSVRGYSDIQAGNRDSVLLKVTKKEDTDSEEQRADLAIFNSVTQDLQQISLPKGARVSSGKLSSSGKSVLYIYTDKQLVAQDCSSDACTRFDFSVVFPDWEEEQMTVKRLDTNRDVSLGVAVMSDGSMVLMNLNDLENLSVFTFDRKPMVVDQAFCTCSDTKTEVIAVGTIEHTAAGDTQGPENQCFISKFIPGQGAPLKTLETEDVTDAQISTLLCKDSLFVVGATKSGGYQLLRINMESFEFMVPAITLPHPVTQLHGNPSEPKAVALTFEGKLLLLDVLKGEIASEVEINNPITNFDIRWEDHLALLGSVKGYVTLYDLGQDKHLLSFPAHSSAISEICILDEQAITLGKNQEVKCWSVQTLTDELKVSQEPDDRVRGGGTGAGGQSLLDQKYVTALSVSRSGDELVLCTEEGSLQVWSLTSLSLLRQYNIEMAANLVQVLADGTVVLLDHTVGKLKLVDLETGKDSFAITSKNVATFTVDADETKLYAVCAPSKGSVVIDVLSLKHGKMVKTIAVQKQMKFESVEARLSLLERFLVLRLEVSEEEYSTIAAMWKKKGSYPATPHQFRFVAIDVTQGNGAQMPCFQHMTKIPYLGEKMEPFKGNVMMITTRRWVTFWDIPTGKCEQKPSRVEKKGMMYRPDWLGQQCVGANISIRLSPDKTFVAVGSEDGYLFIYDADTGIPRGKVKPETKHNAEVAMVAVSPDSKWVSSACRNCIVKLWHSASGKEKFSVRVDAEVQNMIFSPDNKHLLLYTGSQTTRVLALRVHTG